MDSDRQERKVRAGVAVSWVLLGFAVLASAIDVVPSIERRLMWLFFACVGAAIPGLLFALLSKSLIVRFLGVVGLLPCLYFVLLAIISLMP